MNSAETGTTQSRLAAAKVTILLGFLIYLVAFSYTCFWVLSDPFHKES